MLRGNQAAHIVERACNEWIGNAGTVLGFYIDDESKGAAIRGAGSEANVKGNGPLGQRLVFCIFSENAGKRASIGLVWHDGYTRHFWRPLDVDVSDVFDGTVLKFRHTVLQDPCQDFSAGKQFLRIGIVLRIAPRQIEVFECLHTRPSFTFIVSQFVKRI